MQRLIYFLGTLIFIAACDKRTVEDPSITIQEQYRYFPLETGKYIDYQVDSVIYDPLGPSGPFIQENSTTFVRVLVGEAYEDGEGNTAFRMERLERKSQMEDWKLQSIGSAVRTEKEAVQTEDNNRFLKLVFPFFENTDWDGNAYFDSRQEIEIAGERMQPFSNWEYSIGSIAEAKSLNGFDFPNTLTVFEADDTNLIERRFVRTVYAQDLGLVEREMWILDTQCKQYASNADCEISPWEEKAEKGYIMRQKIIGHN